MAGSEGRLGGTKVESVGWGQRLVEHRSIMTTVEYRTIRGKQLGFKDEGLHV